MISLKARNNNRAQTVLYLFLSAVQKYSWPSRMCGDRRGENKDVSTAMILVCGLNRESFIWGS
jgi:hypothetical protein